MVENCVTNNGAEYAIWVCQCCRAERNICMHAAVAAGLLKTYAGRLKIVQSPREILIFLWPQDGYAASNHVFIAGSSGAPFFEPLHSIAGVIMASSVVGQDLRKEFAMLACLHLLLVVSIKVLI